MAIMPGLILWYLSTADVKAAFQEGGIEWPPASQSRGLRAPRLRDAVALV